ncbi:MAG: carbon-nitrogen hydrolase family protein [Anaerolineae bacterium]|nr:carbon-nitrogen hydrolase family protein [Anaerolineae bacterium]
MSQATTLRVAAAQIRVTDQIETNASVIRETMQQCARSGVEIVVFPETALTGYSPAIGHGRGLHEWPTIAEHLEALAALARELGLWTVVGTEAWDEDGWVNRLYVYDDSGSTVATYDKAHLMAADTRYYKPGRRATLFEMHGIKIGLQICYDARFPEGYRALLHRGAQIVMQGFYGAGSCTWKVPVLEAHLRSRAAESGCFIAAANVSGPLQIVVSQIIDPLGLMLAQANQDCEQLIVSELDLGRVAESEIRRDYLERFHGAPS